jgi:hypothetical protein
MERNKQRKNNGNGSALAILNDTIESKNIQTGVYDISWDYHIDEYGRYWYKFDDIIELLRLWKYSCDIYEDIPSDEKMIFNVMAGYHDNYVRTKFISSKAFDELIIAESDRNEQIRCVKWHLESGNSQPEFTDIVTKLNIAINKSFLSRNPKEISQIIDKLQQSDYVRQLNGISEEQGNLIDYLSDAVINNALLDFTIDDSKMDYTMDYDYLEEQPKLNKKEVVIKDKVRYRKNENQESTCPSWIKELI